jgi:hypothetical protein
VHPPLTALTRDIAEYGAHAARELLAAIDGKQVGNVEGGTAQLTPRGSTAPPRFMSSSSSSPISPPVPSSVSSSVSSSAE